MCSSSQSSSRAQPKVQVTQAETGGSRWWRLWEIGTLYRLYPGLNLNLAGPAASPAQRDRGRGISARGPRGASRGWPALVEAERRALGWWCCGGAGVFCAERMTLGQYSIQRSGCGPTAERAGWIKRAVCQLAAFTAPRRSVRGGRLWKRPSANASSFWTEQRLSNVRLDLLTSCLVQRKCKVL